MAFIKRILVPTDFSDAAKNALHYATHLANLTQAEVKVLHVYNIPVVDPYMPGDTMEALLGEIKKEAEHKLATLLAEQVYAPISGECKLGFIADDVCQEASDMHADLIVMGTTGASGVKEVLFGSNASAVITQSPVKVLAVPAVYTSHLAPKSICYAADFTENEEMMFKTIASLSDAWSTKVDVLHVESDEPVFTAEPAAKIFNQIVSEIGAKNFHFHEIQSNEITKAVEDFVASSGADLLVMARHKRNLFERIFHRSKTKEMAHHAKIPLLTLKKS